MLLHEGLRIGRFVHTWYTDPLQSDLLTGAQAVPSREELLFLQIVEFFLKGRFEFLRARDGGREGGRERGRKGEREGEREERGEGGGEGESSVRYPL